jgi:hypothetical protein
MNTFLSNIIMIGKVNKETNRKKEFTLILIIIINLYRKTQVINQGDSTF